MRPSIFALALVLSCADPGDDLECGSAESEVHFVVTTMGYMRNENGVSEGYDLDGTDESICGIRDLEGPDGELGIDNGLSYLVPALEASEAKVVEGYINTGIVEGRILMVVSVSRVDSLKNDACVDVEFGVAAGEPLLGTDGGILPGQTLMRSGLPTKRVDGVAIVDGRLDARPMNLDLPVSLLDANFELNMENGGLRMQFEEDGVASGFFTGSIHQDEVTEILESSEGVDGDVVKMVESIIGLALDIENESGECSSMSAGLEFTAAEIYLMDDPTE
jgi:hypothetical protein